VQYAFRAAGVALPRTAQQQYDATAHIPQSQAQPGDIIFFHDASGHVYHDGIYAGGGRIWAAPHPGASVRLEAIWTASYWVGRVAGGEAPVLTPAPAPAPAPVPAPPTAAPVAFSVAGNPLLKVGSTGPAVAAVQRGLHISADGDFGPQTLGAVMAFQRAHGLVADGVVGPHTWAALRTFAV
jgi:hypothetical protein